MHSTSVSPSWRPRIESTAYDPAPPPQGLTPGQPIELLRELKCPGQIDGRQAGQAGHAALQTMHADGSSVIQTVMPTSKAPEEDKLGFLALLISNDVRDLLVVRGGSPSGKSRTRLDDAFLDEVRQGMQGRHWAFETADRQRVSVRAKVSDGKGLQAPELQVNWEVAGRFPFEEHIRLHELDPSGPLAEMRPALEPFFRCHQSRAGQAGDRAEEGPVSVVITHAPGMGGAGAILMNLVSEWLARRGTMRRDAPFRQPPPSSARAHLVPPPARRVASPCS